MASVICRTGRKYSERRQTCAQALIARLWAKAALRLTPQHITDYQRIRLQFGAQRRNVNIEIATVRQVLKESDLWLPLAGKVRMLRERHDVAKALTPEQEHALLRATAETDSACPTATVVVALNTSMRKDEIRLLRWGQIDFEKRELIVGRSKTEAGAGRLIYAQPTGIRGAGSLG